MPAPDITPDDEPDGRRPPWWRRAVSAALRTAFGRLVGRRNPRGTYRELGREWRTNRRAGMTRRQAARAR